MKTQMLAGLIALSLTTALPQMLRAEDNIEKAGVAVGVSAGNMWFLPIKYLIVMPVEAFFGAVSYVVTGGNSELTKQIWQDNFQGPYVIDTRSPAWAWASVPSLKRKKTTQRHPKQPLQRHSQFNSITTDVFSWAFGHTRTPAKSMRGMT